jgi:hypothetical protein
VEVIEFEHYSEENCTRRALDTEMVVLGFWKFNFKKENVKLSNIKCKVSYKFKRIPLQIKSNVVILIFTSEVLTPVVYEYRKL